MHFRQRLHRLENLGKQCVLFVRQDQFFVGEPRRHTAGQLADVGGQFRAARGDQVARGDRAGQRFQFRAHSRDRFLLETKAARTFRNREVEARGSRTQALSPELAPLLIGGRRHMHGRREQIRRQLGKLTAIGDGEKE